MNITTKRRVGIIVSKYPGGGAQRQALELAKSFVNSNWSAEIIALANTGNEIVEDINVLGLGIAKENFSLKLRSVFKTIKVYLAIRNKVFDKFDVVVLYDRLYGLGAILGDNVVKIFSIRSFHKNSLKSSRIFFLKKYDLITCNSLPQYSLMNALGINCMYINNSILPPNASNGQPSVNKKFLLVSNFSALKNIECAVKAFKMLEDEGIRLTVAGGVIDKKYYQFITQLVGNSKNIFLVGYVNKDKLRELYLSSEALVHTSCMEGTANAILDAMRYRLPAIVSRIPENIALVENIDDFLFDPSSAEELAEKVRIVNARLCSEPNYYNDYIDYQEKKIRLVYTNESLKVFIKEAEKLLKMKKDRHGNTQERSDSKHR